MFGHLLLPVKKFSVALVGLCTFGWSGPAVASSSVKASSFIADYEISLMSFDTGGTTVLETGKIFRDTSGRQRRDITATSSVNDVGQTEIVNGPSGFVCFVDWQSRRVLKEETSPGAAVELTFGGALANAPRIAVGRRPAGNAATNVTVEGRNAEVYNSDSDSESVRILYSADLDYVLRFIRTKPDGVEVFRLFNIKTTPVDASLFEVPNGFTIIE